MKTLIFFFLTFLVTMFNVIGQSVNISWIYSSGGSYNEYPGMISIKNNGQIIIVGSEESNNGDISNHIGTVGAGNVWLITLDSTGVLQSEISKGGTTTERGKYIFLKTDSSLIVGGGARSLDGDVVGLHPRTGTPNIPTDDYWLFEMNSIGGIVWQRCYGGGNEDYLGGITSTFDNGYLMTGTTLSSDGDVSCQYYDEIWVVKTDSVGNIEWTHCYGGIYGGNGVSCCQLTDSSYLITGYSEANFTNAHGASDVVVSKIDVTGNVLWTKCYGGSGLDNAAKILPSGLNFYVIANTNSIDGDVTGYMGYGDIWMFKCDSAGNILWQNCYGGSGIDWSYGGSITSDGGLIFTGYSTSNDSVFVISNHGQFDAWAAKVDSMGNLEWGKSIGGSLDEEGKDIKEIDINHYLLTGSTQSSDGDMPANNHGNKDIWIAKLEVLPTTIQSPTSLIKDLNVVCTSGKLQVTVNSMNEGLQNISISDMLGRVSYQKRILLTPGKNTFELFLSTEQGINVVTVGDARAKVVIAN